VRPNTRDKSSKSRVPLRVGVVGGEALLSESVRDELNDLRKQVAELAMERDVLMRAAAL
jgi:hypothetical protein